MAHDDYWKFRIGFVNFGGLFAQLCRKSTFHIHFLNNPPNNLSKLIISNKVVVLDSVCVPYFVYRCMSFLNFRQKCNFGVHALYLLGQKK